MTVQTTSATNHRPLLRALLIAGLVSAASLALSTPEADARRPIPQPAPPVQAAHSAGFMCEVPVEPPRSVRVAYEEYFECIEPPIDQWLSQYPEELEELQYLYQAWHKGRSHDLRGTSEAARYVRQNPVDFSQRSISLTSRQVMQMAPNVSSDPAEVAGEFQRIFVDRDNRRLFLTSEEIGLVSLAIGARYAFEVEGQIGEPGGRDFFVYDSSTAFVEEEPRPGQNRDLVVLDISDRSNPRELRRLVGVIPAANQAGQQFLTYIPSEAPTFDQYRMIQEARINLPGACGRPPTVSTHANIQCRRDGSCYRLEQREEPAGLACSRQMPPTPAPRPMIGRARPMNDSFDDVQLFGGGGRSGAIATESVTESAPRPRRAAASPRPAPAPPASNAPRRERSAAPVMAEEAAPQGGSGGAGSLSQMMIHGETLYVLSAAAGRPQGWITSFDISQARRPRVSHILALDNGPEALQLHDNLLLVAGRDALVTASLADTNAPRLLGEFRQSCPVNYDPVVVEGSIAYRTVIIDTPRSMCTSRLEIIDLSQPHQPMLRNTHAIQRPRGLAVLGEALFVADEYQGIQVFDLADPISPRHATTWPLRGVKDLVVSDFDLYAMSSDQVQTFYIAPLFQRDASLTAVAKTIEGVLTILRKDQAS